MPIHAYSCQQCKKEFEELYLKMSDVERDEPAVKCPHCQSVKKKRLVPKKTTHIFKSGSWFKGGY